MALAFRDGTLAYFIALEWRNGMVTTILDFRYAPYVLDSVSVVALTS